MRQYVRMAYGLLAAITAAAVLVVAPTPAHAQALTRSFDIRFEGSRAVGTISWIPTVEAQVDGGTVYDTVKDGASGVAFAHYRISFRRTTCTEDPPSCHTETGTIEPPEQQIGRVSTGVGTIAPIEPFQVPLPGDVGAITDIGLWVRVCTIDFSEGRTLGCSGLG